MTLKIIVRKLFPIPKGTALKVLAAKSAAGDYYAGQITIDALGMEYDDARYKDGTYRITGRVIHSEVTNRFTGADSGNWQLFWTYITLETTEISEKS